MGDPLTASIDSLFDTVDAVIDEGGAFLSRVAKSGDKASGKRVIDIDAKPTTPAPSSIKPRRYRIIESIDAQTGVTTFIVTDDNTRTECPSAEVAERIRSTLENA